MNVPRKDLAAVDALRQGPGLANGYVLVYPGPTPSGATYPTESWIAILKDFQQRQPDLPLALLQTDDAAPQTAAIASAVPGLKILRPETPGQTAALIAAANLLVAVEGYPLGLAIALNVYTLGLFASDSMALASTPEPRSPGGPDLPHRHPRRHYPRSGAQKNLERGQLSLLTRVNLPIAAP